MKDLRLFDALSADYASTRRADPRIAGCIRRALGAARRVLNVGAGTGNYEPADLYVVAVEPSGAMIAKRAPGAPAAVQAAAEDLPFPGGCFDAAMAVLTVHHWRDWRQGLSEMRRAAPRQVIYLFEPEMINRFWAMDRYWPEAASLPSERDAIGARQVASVLDVVAVNPVPVPFDCTDGFGAAFWGRPEAYLDAHIQRGMSWLAQLTPDVLARGSARLAADLRSGEWDRQYGQLRRLDHLDVGHRLITAGS